MQIMHGFTIIVAAATLRVGFASEGGHSYSSRVTPVQKVTQLMGSMLEKGKKEKHDEQIQFAAYRQFCDDTSAEKERAIAKAHEEMAMLSADIQKYTANAAKLTKEIAGLDGDLALWQGDIKAATKVRDIEDADHKATHKDYSETIYALEHAIDVLGKNAHDWTQAESLLQLSALKHMTLIPEQTKHLVDAFVQDADEYIGVDAPESNAYQFHSTGVIEMLTKLHNKFVTERTNLEKEEMDSRHAYDLLMQDLHAQMTQGEKDRTSKAQIKAKKLEAKAGAFGALKDLMTTQIADQKYLQDMTATCSQKADDFESRQQLRSEELNALEKTIEIISSRSVAGSAEKHLPSLVQLPRATSFAQFRTSRQSQLRTRVIQYLQGRSKQLESRVLAALTEHLTDDPFMKVRQIIKNLITRLMEEAGDEAEHKGWCDEELATNERTRREKTDAVETLHADIDELTASSAKLAEEITDLSHAVAELAEAMSKATTLRQEEKAKNSETVQDAMEAQEAVEHATMILKEFYAKAGDATAFFQKGAKQPEIFDTPFKGMAPESGGVMGMLEVIQSDFARLESDTKAAEAKGQKEYDAFMSDSKVDSAQKKQMIEHGTAKAQDQKQTLQQKMGDLEGTQKELDAALVYFEKLRPSCVDSGVSYEDRVARRREEIESLQSALKILNGGDIA